MGLAGVGGTLWVDSSVAASMQGEPVKPTTQAVELFTKLVDGLTGKVKLTYMAGTVWGFPPQADDLALADFARRWRTSFQGNWKRH